jgi:hypothetical protein
MRQKMRADEWGFAASIKIQPAVGGTEGFVKTNGPTTQVIADNAFLRPAEMRADIEIARERTFREDRFAVDDGTRIDQTTARKDFSTRFTALGIDPKAIGERAARVCEEAPDSLGGCLLGSPADVSVALLELIDPACRVDQALLTRIEWV